MIDRRLFVAALLAATSLLCAHDADAQHKIRVVASFSILGDLVREVGGDRVDVTTLVGANGDAHGYSPKPSDSAKIANADLVIVNGLGFEGWADRLLRAASGKGRRLVASRGVKTLQTGGVDPHAWQDVANVKIYVANIRDALSEADPAAAGEYRARAAAYLARLEALDAEIRTTFADIPQQRRKVVTSHDAFAYFGDAYGLVFYSPLGVGTESAGSARTVSALIRQIKAEGITAVFVESMTNRRLIDQVAKETGARVGGTLYPDALSAGPPADTYIEMMRHNARLIAEAVRQRPGEQAR